MLLSDLWLQSLFCRPGIPCLKSSVCKKSGRPRTVSRYSKLHLEVRLHRTVICLTPLHKTDRIFTQMQRSSTPQSPFSAFLSWSWSFPLQATSAPRLSLTPFLFLKFLLLIKSLKTLVQYHHFLVLPYSLENWLILRVIWPSAPTGPQLMQKASFRFSSILFLSQQSTSTGLSFATLDLKCKYIFTFRKSDCF